MTGRPTRFVKKKHRRGLQALSMVLPSELRPKDDFAYSPGRNFGCQRVTRRVIDALAMKNLRLVRQSDERIVKHRRSFRQSTGRFL
jgi:hypothetical protein